MSDVWVVLIVITVIITARELFIWLVGKMITWTRLLWNKIKLQREKQQQLKSQEIADLRLKRKIKRAETRTRMEGIDTDAFADETVYESQYSHEDNNPIDNTVLYQNIKNQIMQAQRDDAKKRLERPDYWLDTGYWVSVAVDKIELAIDAVPMQSISNPERWLRKVIEQVQTARDKFRCDCEDPDGYGIATFHEVIRALDGLVGKTKDI